MLIKPTGCEGCPLFDLGQGFTRTEGTGALGLMIVGEASGENERRTGLPFRPEAPAGSVLERAIKRTGYSREQFVVTNVVRCQPPKNWLDGAPWEPGAVDQCRLHMDQVFTQFRPRAILALGGVALRAMTGMAGKGRNVTMLRGYVLEGTRYPGVPVIATYHPSFLRRGSKGRDEETGVKTEGGAGKGGMHLLGVVCRDLTFAVQVAREGFSYDPPQYVEHPSLDEARNFLLRVRDNPNLIVTYDIETLESGNLDEEDLESAGHQITQIQFSLEPGTGIALPWRDEYVEVARGIMATSNTKAGHNTLKFDNPRLRARGLAINGVVHDTMEMWRRAQPDIPAGLQFVASFYGFPFPWKHLADSRPEFYGCCDVDAPQRIMAKLPDDMKAKGTWRSYESHVLGLEPILVRMSQRGLPIQDEKRLEFAAELDKELGRMGAEVQKIVPDVVRNVHPKNGYKKPPADAVVGVPTTHQNEPATWDKRTLTILGKDLQEDHVERWVKVLAFNPGSSQQLIHYMQHRGHPVPKDMKTSKDTTAHRELERLEKRTKDPLYRMMIERRGVQVMRSTFVKGWAPGPDGRVHSQFYHGTGSGQLSSRHPNVQNRPSAKYGDAAKMHLAETFAAIIEAKPGHKLIELDYKSAHALTLGFEAKDPDYMRLARIDTHGFFAAAGLLRLERPEKLLALPDAELKAYLKGLRKSDKLYSGKTFESIRNDKAKKTILGYGFGMGARTLYNQNSDAFDSERDAKKTIDALNGIFGRTAKFRDTIRMKAHRDTNLISRHGYIRWFFDVYHWDHQRGLWLPGDDSEAAIAFLPANDAHGHMKDAMLTIEERGWDELYRLINQIHDALLFECPDELVEECIWNVKGVMERPSEILVDRDVAPEGLWIEVSASVGQDLAHMEEVEAKMPLPKAA